VVAAAASSISRSHPRRSSKGCDLLEDEADARENNLSLGDEKEMKMKSESIHRVLAPVLLLVIALGGVARGNESPGAESSSRTIPTSSSALDRTGDFFGTVIETGTTYALRVDGESALHPLLVLGSPPVIAELRSGTLTGREVRVSGIHYASNGAILVSGIEPRS
jgi:hypothetical protein